MARAAARALIVIVWLEKRPGIVICCLVLKLVVCVCVIKIIIINDNVDVEDGRLVGYASQDCDLLPGYKVDRMCVMKIIIINHSVDVKGDPLVGYASQDCDLLPGIKDAF